jgi:ubiquinone/menaquinone biosynthesis C-methylase UbiE
MALHTCPVWLGYIINCPLRKLLHNPRKILGPHVAPGMKVLDVGCAMGFFSLPLAEMVGPTGTVVSVDAQGKMLSALRKRAVKAGLGERIETRHCGFDSLQIDEHQGSIDFALVFAMVHEVENPDRLFAEIAQALKPSGHLLFAEPTLHVPRKKFEESLALARQKHLQLASLPAIPRSRAALLIKVDK